MRALSATEVARARSVAYALLSRLLAAPPDEAARAQIEAIPALSAVYPAELSADELAAQHQQLFGMSVLPYESLFLGEDGMLGGAHTEAVAQFYRECSYRPVQRDVSPDHLSVELDLLRFLCAAEAQMSAPVATLRAQQYQLLQAHLLRWLIPLAVALRQEPYPFYAALVDLALDIAAEQFAELTDTQSAEASGPSLGADLDLTAESTGFHAIAAYLLQPNRSGFYLSRDAIGRLGRRHRLPRGFGARHQMLVNLLRSAAQYDQMPALLQALQSDIATVQSEHERAAAAWPVLAPFSTPWQQRLAATGRLLTAIEKASHPA